MSEASSSLSGSADTGQLLRRIAELEAENAGLRRERVASDPALLTDQISTAALAGILEHLPVGVGVIDRSGRFILRNPVMARYAGDRIPSRDDRFGRWRAYHPDGTRLEPAEYSGGRALRGETVLPGIDFLYEQDDGTEVWTRVAAVPLSDAGNGEPGAIIVVQDIDESRRASAKLAASLEELQAPYDTAPVGLCMLDRDLRFLRINERLAEINGVSVEGHIGRTVAEIVPGLLDEATAMLGRVIETGQPVLNHEITGDTRAHPGAQRSWLESWVPVFDGRGNIVAVNIVAEETTEKKRTERELRMLAAVVEQTADFIGIAGPDEKAFYLNEAGRSLVGLPDMEAVQQTSVMDCFMPEDQQFARDVILPTQYRDGRWIGEFRFRRFDTGEAVPVHYNQFVIRDDQGEVLGIAAVARDITDMKKAEAALLEARMRAEGLAAERVAVLSQLDEGVIVTDEAGRIVFVNQAATAIHGVERLDIGPDDYAATYHLFTEDGRPFPPEELPLSRAVLKGETVAGARWRIRRPDGTEVLAIGSARPVFAPDGAPLGAVLTMRDDTERHAAEEQLRASEARLRAAVQASPFPMMLHAEDGEVLELSRKWSELTGYAREEIRTHFDWFRLAYPDRFEEIGARMDEEFAAEGEIVGGEIAILVKDGSTRIWDFHNVRVGSLPDGRRVQISAASDVTERKRWEDRVRESEQRLHAVLNNTTMAVFLMDDRQQCVYMNAAAEALTGFSFDEVQGRTLHDVVHHTHPDGRPFPIHECPIDRAFRANNQVQGEEMFIHKDGHFYPVAFTASPIRNAAAKAAGTIIEARDITADRESAERLQLLIGELNHRVKNTLATVQSIAWQALRGDDVPAHARESIESRLIALSRSHDLLTREEWGSAGLRDLAVEALEPFGVSVGRADRLEIRGDNIRLRPKVALALGMAFHELATNAVKYGALSNDEGTVQLAWTLSGGGRLRLTWVEQNGPPVSPPSRKGFGSRLIESGLAYELDGEVQISYPSEGVVCSIEMPAKIAGGG